LLKIIRYEKNTQREKRRQKAEIHREH
jgi:hypothetical protein